MTLDNTTISIIMAVIASAGLYINAVIHWDKIRRALTSNATIAVAKTALLFGCFWFGPWALVVGNMVYIMLAVIDFVRTGDNSCGAIGAAVMTASLGVFNFAIQFALVIKDK